jgi:UDP-4-amino-4,6-dideoxy-N-acetyl-beta-L-altrosamine N-acetyltransferase
MIGGGVLRPARDNDTDDIRRWRNHPQVRAASLTTHEIGADEHVTWFAAACVDARRRVLVHEFAGTACGVVNFADIDPNTRSASWGFFLDVDGLQERGETLPAWMTVQREAVAYAFDTLGLDELTGEVREDNIVVRRMNKRLGFAEGEPAARIIDGSDIRVFPIVLRRDTYDARARERSNT